MKIEFFDIEGPILLTPPRHFDSRGFFSETFNLERFRNATGLQASFVQDNESFSAKAGTIRGLHYQGPPFAQAKLVRCLSGKITDIAVDVRVGSKTYGQYIRTELCAENGAQIWVPGGFLHGFATHSDNTIVSYKVTKPYAPECEGSICYDDPLLKIDWGLNMDPILSEKDAMAESFEMWQSPFTTEISG